MLRILARREDGFHELESVLHPIPLFDELRFDWDERRGIHLECSDSRLPIDSKNLVYRAAQSFQKTIGRSEGIRIRLTKHLPIAAGLGGGSGNAAATLKGLNAMYDKALSHDQLVSLAADLGSDVPFFLQSKPALAIGRGEKIRPLGSLQIFQNAAIILVNPGFEVSTAWAYKHLQADAFEKVSHSATFINILKSGDWESTMRMLFNSLQKPVFQKYPILALIASELVSAGACAALLSGSGATLFGMLQNPEAGNAVKSRFLKKYGNHCWCKIIPLQNDSNDRNDHSK